MRFSTWFGKRLASAVRSNRKPPRQYAIEGLERRELLAADNFFVSPTGNDSAAGTAAAPWRTLQKAATTVDAGDVVTVRAGTYVGFDLRTDGTAAAPITFTAEPGVTINQRNARTPDGINLEGADYIVIEGFAVNGIARAGIRSVTNHHVTIRNNSTDQNGVWGIFTGFSDDLLIENNTTTRSGDEHGIYVSNSGDRPVIRGNTIWGNHANGIHLNGDESAGGDGIISGALIEDNIIYENGAGGGSGINGDGLQDSIIRNNLLYDNHASGISLYQIDAAEGAKNNLVVNNTIVMASNARWALNIKNASTGNRVFNNILYNNHPSRGSIDIAPAALAGFVSDYNVVMNRFTTNDNSSQLTLAQWRAATGQDMHSIVATPSQLFVSAAADDYALSTSSPAVNAGTSTSAPSDDLEGTPRPIGGGWDIGAYEFSTGSTDTTPPQATAIALRGSSWNAAVPSATLTLAGSGGATLPWTNLDTISITFDEPVIVTANDLDYTGDGIGDPTNNFSYDAAARTAQWRVPTAFAAADIAFRLSSDVTDVAGNPIAATLLATARVRPGDVNGDAAVTTADLHAHRTGQFVGLGAVGYQARNDIDGNGLVNVVDWTLIRNHQSIASASALVAKTARDESRNVRRERASRIARANLVDATLDTSLSEFPSSRRRARP